jgi:hypothetical protein
MACSATNFLPGCGVDCCTDPRCEALTTPCAQGLLCTYLDHGERCDPDGTWHCYGGGVIGGFGSCAPAGVACQHDTDCTDGNGSVGRCLLSTSVDWPGGFCTADCSPAENDPTSGGNPGCPVDGLCATRIGVYGMCVGDCQAGCRAGYACVIVNAHGSACIPSSLLDGGAGDGGS